MPQGSDSRYQLFISYSGSNRELIQPFVEQLEADGFVVFYDQDRGVGLGSLPMNLADKLAASDHVVACLTPEYLSGPWPRFELAIAIAQDPAGDDGRVIPVWFNRDGVVPRTYLAHLTQFDLTRHDPYGRSYGLIRDAIRERLAHPPPPPDRDQVAGIVADALDRPDDPQVVLFKIRLAGRQLAQRACRDLLGQDPGGRSLEALADDLLRSGVLPRDPAAALGRLRAFGGQALRDEPGLDTDETVERALAALRELRDWMFPRPAAAPEQALAPVEHEAASALRLVRVSPVAADMAWPLGDDVLVWDERGGRLRCLRGGEVRWQDTDRIRVRRFATGTRDRVAVGGWEGLVRYFAGDPEPLAALSMDGTVGDLRCTADGLIAGSWRHALWRIDDHGRRTRLGPVQGGVHRVAIFRDGRRFAVAELTGRVTVYHDDHPVHPVPIGGPVADLAYAGPRLVLLTDEAVAGWRVDGVLSAPVPMPGASSLLPVGDRPHCMAVVTGPGPRAELRSVDEYDRHVPELLLRPGETVLGADTTASRLLTRGPAGVVYRRDGAEVASWPDATGAGIAADGRRLAVCRPGRVELLEDPA
ncbi:toll/interleukin-1 receptor domain-containing protein [Actinoplanes sp. Pm04-4]|uniref:Toll/interleukin-1 receptor domain-containing protein n=1 Tax=Paractinoplanes pyxinae TaxID=2997416 RepID=A0ABT4AZF8_9ACTN|nr:toll/interleukin-1 receptor domain-containing protein [Actinoplanes pyxinae]MCY1139629.1 toll/interleukin-1 receptor domain-containing protein [Actinoplanes pyxinae]